LIRHSSPEDVITDELQPAIEVKQLGREAEDSKMGCLTREAVENTCNCWFVVWPHLLGVLDHAR
jgi:hypothetical protein